MKVTLKEIYISKDSLAKLNALKPKARISYKIAKIIAPVLEEIETVEKMRFELVKKHGVQDSEIPTNYTVPEANVGAFNDEFIDLLETEIELPDAKINVKFIEDTESLSVNDFILLDYITTD